MRNKTLLAVLAGIACLALATIGGNIAIHAAAETPPCECLNLGFQWTVNGTCNNQLCSTQSLVTDSLACDDVVPPGPCPVSGSVTVAYDDCTTLVCVRELHIGCGAGCQTTGYRALQDGQTDTPTLNACCETQTGCIYRYEVTFWNGATTCPGTPAQLHCRYERDFQCAR